MEQWGNGRAALYYEACVPSDYRRPREGATPREMEKWIRDKYEHKRFLPRDGRVPAEASVVAITAPQQPSEPRRAPRGRTRMRANSFTRKPSRTHAHPTTYKYTRVRAQIEIENVYVHS
jgi:hypothetical protein